jgi:hypothetical protein
VVLDALLSFKLQSMEINLLGLGFHASSLFSKVYARRINLRSPYAHLPSGYANLRSRCATPM